MTSMDIEKLAGTTCRYIPVEPIIEQLRVLWRNITSLCQSSLYQKLSQIPVRQRTPKVPLLGATVLKSNDKLVIQTG